MKKKGILWMTAFILWTMCIQMVDVQAIGQNGTDVGFATLNMWFHKLTGVHMSLYHITDWLGLVPVGVCMIFGCLGLGQWIKRKSLFKVDRDLILLGFYYIIVIWGYLIFEMVPINYRPVLINGFMEASYPSSTTLLVLSVMLAFAFQMNRRLKNDKLKQILSILTNLFMLFMVAGRMISGVHWLTDIVGSVMFSIGLFNLYQACVLKNERA